MVETAVSTPLETPIEKQKLVFDYVELAGSIRTFLSQSFYLIDTSLTEHLKEFCICIDIQQAYKSHADTSILSLSEALLKKIISNSYSAPEDLERVKRGLIKLHLDLSKAIIIKIMAKSAVLTQNKHYAHNVCEAIKQFEPRFNPGMPNPHSIVLHAVEHLLKTDLDCYFKPSKDPMKIHLLNALKTLYISLR